MATTTYCTTEQVKGELGEDVGNSDLNTRIERNILAASRQIDTWTGRRGKGFWLADSATARVFTATDAECLDVDEFATTSGLIVKTDGDGTGAYGTTLTINTGFMVHPFNAATLTPVEPYTGLLFIGGYYAPISSTGIPGVQVTARWGWPAVPAEVEQAAIVQAVALFKSAASITGLQVAAGGPSSPGGGGLVADAAALVADFVRYL